MCTSMGRGSIIRREECNNISLCSFGVPVHSLVPVLPCRHSSRLLFIIARHLQSLPFVAHLTVSPHSDMLAFTLLKALVQN